jgi:hypothetical protein
VLSQLETPNTLDSLTGPGQILKNAGRNGPYEAGWLMRAAHWSANLVFKRPTLDPQRCHTWLHHQLAVPAPHCTAKKKVIFWRQLCQSGFEKVSACALEYGQAPVGAKAGE